MTLDESYQKGVLIARSAELNNMYRIWNEAKVDVPAAVLGMLLNRIDEIEDKIKKLGN